MIKQAPPAAHRISWILALIFVSGMAIISTVFLSFLFVVHGDMQKERLHSYLTITNSVLDVFEDSVHLAAVRISKSPELQNFLKENDDYATVVFLNRKMKEENLDFGVLFKVNNDKLEPWMNGATFQVFDNSHFDKSLIQLTSLLNKDKNILAMTNSPPRFYTEIEDTPNAAFLSANAVEMWYETKAFFIAGKHIGNNSSLADLLCKTLLQASATPPVVSLVVKEKQRLNCGQKPNFLQEKFDILTHERTPENLTVHLFADRQQVLHFAKLTIIASLILAAIVCLLGFILINKDAKQKRHQAEIEQLHSEAQIMSLKSQIQPHFLFNTLNMIAQLCRIDGERARIVVTKLASLYRLILQASHTKLSPLLTEIQIVEEYLEIQRYRFGERLSYSVDYEAQVCQAVCLPTLLLQVLVENAVIHGVAKALEGGQITVKIVKQQGKGIELSVTNTGAKLESNGAYGTGLSNTIKRLQVIWPNKHNFSLSSNANNETVATFFIPEESEIL